MQTTLIDDARAIFQAAIQNVQPREALGSWLQENVLFERFHGGQPVRVVGMGKAARSMAGVMEAHLGEQVRSGIVVVPEGYAAAPLPGPAPRQITVREAGHPVPTEASQEAAQRMRALAERCSEAERLLVLISGGGTALTADFARGISLDEGRRVFQLLLEAGVEIHDVNAVRKHLTTFGGGRLAAVAHPAPVCALVISDVVGNDLSTIASGPTVPDPTTFGDAISVLRAANLWRTVPESVRRHLQAGAAGDRPESIQPGDPRGAEAKTYIVATNRDALEAAGQEARRRGYAVTIADEPFTGEARVVGRTHATSLVQDQSEVQSSGPRCILWGGESTVTVTGPGTGGRNQEAALGAAQALADTPRDAVFLSAGTDGIDGPTAAAGAWATPQTLRRGQAAGLSAEAHLQNNDAYAYFDTLGTLLITGPTHTNVMDVQIGLLGASEEL